MLVASALPDPVLIASSFLTSRGPVSLPQAFPRLPAKGLSPFWAMCMPFWTEEALGLFKDTPPFFLPPASSPQGLPPLAGSGHGN